MKQIKRLLLIMLFAVGCWFLYIGFHIWTYDEKPSQHANVAVVLGAAVYDDTPSPVFKGRIDYAVELYNDGRVDKLLFTGGRSNEDRFSEATTAKQYAMAQGVTENAILVEEASTITEENLRFAKALLEEEKLTTVMIVSDPLHMKRAILIANDLAIAAQSAPTPYSAYQSLKTKVPFFVREWFYTIGYKVTKPFRQF